MTGTLGNAKSWFWCLKKASVIKYCFNFIDFVSDWQLFVPAGFNDIQSEDSKVYENVKYI